MFFDFLAVVGLIAFIVLSYLFFLEQRKTKERFSESHQHLTDNVEHINCVVNKNQSELVDKLSEQYLETIGMFQEEREIVQANKELFEKMISESTENFQRFANTTALNYEELEKQVVEYNVSLENFITNSELHQENLENKITDNNKFLTDQLRTLATVTAKLRADNEELKKQIAFFTEIRDD